MGEYGLGTELSRFEIFIKIKIKKIAASIIIYIYLSSGYCTGKMFCHAHIHPAAMVIFYDIRQ